MQMKEKPNITFGDKPDYINLLIQSKLTLQ